MLPAPIIEGTLPAFYADEKGMVTITVPFSMSRAVNRNEVKGFKLKIKNLQGSTYLKTVNSKSIDYDKSVVIFEMLPEELTFIRGEESVDVFTLGLFYKAQIAYVDTADVTGYYSTVGIIKYTSKPYLSIFNMSSSRNNTHCYTYTGIYSQKAGTKEDKRDPTEKVYSYRFVIRDNKNQIVVDTGYLIHNSSNDVAYDESSDSFTYNYDLINNDKYTITYSVKTNNGLEIEGPSYKIVQKEAIPLKTIEKLIPIVDHDNGLIEIFFNVHPNPQTSEEKQQAKEDALKEDYAKGRFVLTRSSEDFQYENWEQILEFSLFAQKPSTQSWKDFTVEQGKKYKYSLQQYSKTNQLYSNRLISEAVMADFEDSFLYDGFRQLKIKFNPKISSFKKNIFETKVDTLGSKYPFIFRNGQSEYKEFPVAGLISYLMDEQSFFGNNSDQFFTKEREITEVFTPFSWKAHDNPIIRRALRKNQYEKNYKYFYIWDSIEQNYISWIDFLKRQYDTNEININKYKDYSDYNIYFDESKNYYLKDYKEINSLDIDKLKLKTTNLTSSNIAIERDFKMEVLDWLTNGEPKLFRSPAEGNFIIRLINVSLSPEDKLGRMLHTFNSTAYEMADFTYDNLKKYNFINTQGFKKTYFKVQSIPLITNDENYQALSNIKYNKDSNDGFYYAIESLMPLSAGQVEFLEISNCLPGTEFWINGESVKTGNLGYIKLELPITSIYLKEPISYRQNYDPVEQGVLTVGYYTDIDDTFSYISSVEIKENYSKQFIGATNNIIDKLEDLITKPISYYLIRAWKRNIEEVDFNPAELNEDEKKALLPIYFYQYETETHKVLGDLYREVQFGTTNFYDSMYAESLLRDPDYRTSTNPALIDQKDFSFLVDNEFLYYYDKTTHSFKLVTEETEDQEAYFLKEKIKNIFDPLNEGEKYLNEETYNLYESLWKKLKVLDINSLLIKEEDFKNYKLIPYTLKVEFKDGGMEAVDIKDSNYFEMKNFDNIQNYNISAGVYTDLTYSVQITNYDISKNAFLLSLKTKVDACYEILSYEGMKKFSYYNPNKKYQDYLDGVINGFKIGLSYTMYGQDEITFNIGDSFKNLYKSYLDELESYIKTLEDFNK